MLILRPVQPTDADILFPMIYHSPVTDTLAWDGPDSLDEYRQGLTHRTLQTAHGEDHMMTMVVEDDLHTNPPVPIGSADIRPEPNQELRADIGLWIGQPYHGKGYGTLTIRWMVDYGFTQLGLAKIEASVYAGNWASRRIFEKNGFILEGTIRKATLKRGQWQDDWRLGITCEDYQQIRRHAPIFHICTQADWQAAQASGGSLIPASVADAGFIHCSLPEHILWVANGIFRGQFDLLLLEIDPLRVQAEIRWDPAEHTFFPHIYGPLNIDAVAATHPLKPDPDGVFRKLKAGLVIRLIKRQRE
jgi:uncharacterized protein (DUF952 family)/RimJ/RimL family protein N-acetyltransferase